MRKFLMAAALVSVAACGDKPKTDGNAMAGTPTTVADSTAKADSMKRMMARDSIVKDSIAKDSAMKASMAMPPKKKP